VGCDCPISHSTIRGCTKDLDPAFTADYEKYCEFKNDSYLEEVNAK
jgi:hypothetical protein